MLNIRDLDVGYFGMTFSALRAFGLLVVIPYTVVSAAIFIFNKARARKITTNKRLLVHESRTSVEWTVKQMKRRVGEMRGRNLLRTNRFVGIEPLDKGFSEHIIMWLVRDISSSDEGEWKK